MSASPAPSPHRSLEQVAASIGCSAPVAHEALIYLRRRGWAVEENGRWRATPAAIKAFGREFGAMEAGLGGVPLEAAEFRRGDAARAQQPRPVPAVAAA